jgi:hypothetical protein
MNEKPKFTLNLNEVNTLGFALTIEGSSSDVDSTSPVFRFVLSERNGEKAWLYPMYRDDDGDIAVSIPTETHFLENKTYHGQVEVVLGNHYFVPTTVDIEFIKPLKVEAVAKVKNKTNLLEEKEEPKPFAISSVTARTKNKLTKETVPEQSSQPRQIRKENVSWDDLSEQEKKRTLEIIKQRKLEENKRLRLAEEAKKKLQEKKKNDAETTIKDQLKSMISTSLMEDDDDEDDLG